MTPSESLIIFGTEQGAAAPLRLHAGPLSLSFEAGQLRDVCWDGVEVLRGVSFLARDAQWGTAAMHLQHLQVDGSGIMLRYQGRLQIGTAALRLTAHISAQMLDELRSAELRSAASRSTGSRSTELRFDVAARAEGDVLTQRTGFVVLHPADAAGLPLTVEHGSGQVEQTQFAHDVAPHQPIFDIHCLTHVPLPGVTVRCECSGDPFEMEDQRNWTDASFKTYVRPLAWPRPYVIADGAEFTQSVHVLITDTRPIAPQPSSTRGRATARAAASLVASASNRATVTLAAHTPAGRMPILPVGWDHSQAAATVEARAALQRLGLRMLTPRIELDQPGAADALAAVHQLARALGCTVALEVVTAGRDPDGDMHALAELWVQHAPEHAQDQAIHAASGSAALPGALASLVVIPRRDLRDRPAALPAGDAPLVDIVQAARTRFPGVPIGGGTAAFFTELNRHRPPPGLLDLITHQTSAITHAADDDAVMQTLQTLPAIARTVRSFATGARYRMGLAAIGQRTNPYGSAVAITREALRSPACLNDPRQRGLFAAAFAIGTLAQAIACGVDEVTLAMTTGPFGLVHTPQPWHTPGWEAATLQPYPLFGIVAALAGQQGQAVRPLRFSGTQALMGFAIDAIDAIDAGRQVWVANVTAAPVKLLCQVDGVSSFASMDASALVAHGAERCLQLPRAMVNAELVLAPYGVAVLR